MRRTFYFAQSSVYACLGSNSFAERWEATSRLHQLQYSVLFQLPQSQFFFSPLNTEMIKTKTHLGFLPLKSGNFIIGWIGGIFFLSASIVEIVFLVYKAFDSTDENDESNEKRTGKSLKKLKWGSCWIEFGFQSRLHFCSSVFSSLHYTEWFSTLWWVERISWV